MSPTLTCLSCGQPYDADRLADDCPRCAPKGDDQEHVTFA